MEDVMSKYRVGLQRFADFRKTVKSLLRLEMAVTSVYAIFLLWQSGPYYFEIRAGEANFKAGDYSNAEQHLLSALRLSNRLADGDVRRIRAVNNLAELYRATRRFADAENYSLVALAHAQQYLVGKAEYISCINNLAVIRRDEGDYVSSQSLFEQALALAAKPQYKSYSNQLPTLYTNQAKLFYLTGNYETAKLFLDIAYKKTVERLGGEDASLAVIYENMAKVELAQRHYSRAESFASQALCLDTAALGAWHPIVAIDHDNIAEVFLSSGDFSNAEKHFLCSTSIRVKNPGKNNRMIALCNYNLARVRLKQGRLAEARLLAKHAMELQLKFAATEKQGIQKIALLMRTTGA